MLLLSIALGGALGTLARYGLATWVYGRVDSTFPWGTVVVNAVGSSAIGLVMRFAEASAVTEDVRAFITIGLLGGFTTFSSFSFEAVALFRAGRSGLAVAYSLGSVLIGLIAVLAGLGVATLLLRMRT